MTALTAGYLANEPFKNSSQTTVINGIKSKEKENPEKNKLEFVEGGVLEAPPSSSNVIKLKPQTLVTPSPSPATSLTNFTFNKLNINSPSRGIKRKRLLSDRFEKEAKYPVVESTVASLTSWDGCDKVQQSGALAGIRNPHNNCFLNSVLQALCHIPQFGRFIIEKHQQNGPNCYGHNCLLCALRSHIMRGLNQSVNDAGWVNRYFEDIFPNHIRGTQEDAHEMLLFLLDAIDRQQQRIRRSLPGKVSSIIEQVFDGKIRCEYSCTTCQKKSICYEPTRGLSVDIPRHTNNDPNHSTMSRIVRNFFAEERIQGYDCKNCKKKTIASKKTKIVTAPNVLIIQLKRFLRYAKITDPVFICKTIDLSDILHDTDCASYKLLGYIRHIGGTMSSGHYTSTFTGFDNKIYHFDDETKSPGNIQYQKPLQPYILFYSKYKKICNYM